MTINKQANLSSPHDFKKSILGLFVTLICALLLAGCSSGGSGGSGDFIASPTGNAAGGGANAGNGSVTFNFVRAQNAVVVPLNTVNLRIEFFTGLEGTGAIVKSDTVPFAPTVTIEGVPSSARSSVVTALTVDGIPLATFVVSTSVPANGNVVIDGLSGTTTPVTVQTLSPSPQSVSLSSGSNIVLTVQGTFSNGDVVTIPANLVTFVSNDTSLVTVQADGTVAALVDGSTSITVTFDGQTTTIPVIVGTGVIAPPQVTNLALATVEVQPVNLPRGTVSQAMTVTATFDNGNVQVVTAADGVVFESNNPEVTVNGSGQIAVSAAAIVGSNAVITARFMGAEATATATVSDEILVSISVEPASVSVPFGGFEQQLVATGVFSDGETQLLNTTEVTFAESPATTRFDVTAAGLITSSGVVEPTGTSNVLVTEGISGNSVQTTVPVTVGAITVVSLTVTPPGIPVDPVFAPGQRQEFTVVANLSGDNGTIDVSDFAALVLTAGGPQIAVSGKQVVAVSPTGGTPVNATFSFAGATFDVPINVSNEFLVSVEFEFAGNPIVDQTVNLPRGYVGIIEGIGTFNTGAVRPLAANEYDVQPSATPGDDPFNRLRRWDDTYVFDPPLATLFDGLPLPGTDPTFESDGAGAVLPPAVVDDLLPWFNGPPFRQVLPVGSPHPDAAITTVTGSDDQVVATRATFKGVVADWQRGVDVGGGIVPPGTTSDTLVSGDGLATDVSMPAPGSQRFFDITLAASVTDPANPTALDETLSVTITDPTQVTFASAGFKNYPTATQVPIGTVREFEVRVDFKQVDLSDINGSNGIPPSTGPTVEAFENFKLAEANVRAISAVGGVNPFSFNTPTAIGYVGVASDTPVDVNVLNIYAMPVGGDAVRSRLLSAPVYGDPLPIVAGVPRIAYTPGTYESVERVFGVSFPQDLEEDAGYSRETDPGPADPTPEAQSNRDPIDFTRRIFTELNDAIVFLRPVIFSIDPVNPGGGVGVPRTRQIGESFSFKTSVQFRTDSPLEDRSLDYVPRLIVNTGNPAFVGRSEQATGQLVASAVLAGGGVVGAGDSAAQTGFPALTAHPDVVAAEGVGAQALVIALDAVGNPIAETELFPGTFIDSVESEKPLADQIAGAAQSITTLNVGP